ncbi:recombinase family protein [Anaerobacillus alkalidiazotrophicus]|uniref:Recombinase family protein n=1 Tax=Anaerobacillus alkalidiazotrophicus TaxID=472963 RepID=A0A1S2MBP3_9BACI|nr:recombinase family protein [Anaerobacillus alkalidiazotrophicus]OIJ22006.1 recombinase family protein [Anaerobacillus alkalidiazotrophicus]
MIAIYARVSTEEQAKNGYSLSEQIRACKQKAEGTLGVMEYVDEGLSGEFLDRPALTRLRKDIKEGIIERVICLDPDRLSRKLMNQLILSEEIEKKAHLIFVNGEYKRTPEGMLFYQMRGAIAEFEKAKITERMSRGRREKARIGKVLRDFQVYGYNYNKENEQFEVNEYEAKVVKLIFELFTKPNDMVEGVNGIAKYLTNQGIPTKRNAKQWHRQVVRQLLMNRAYVGEFYQNRWNTEGMLGNRYKSEDERIKMTERPKEEWIAVSCPVIIDKEQFEHAQALLNQSRRRWSGMSKNEYLLSGLVRCAECGNTMTGRKQKNWGTYVFEYTDVKNTAGAKHKGCGNHIRCEELDIVVWEKIKGWLNNPEEIAASKEEESNNVLFEEVELERLTKEIERINKGKQRLLTLIMEDNDDLLIADVRQKLKDINESEKQLFQQKEKIEMELMSHQQLDVNENIIKKASEYYLGLASEEISIDIKKELIRSVVKEIRVSHEKNVDIYTL